MLLPFESLESISAVLFTGCAKYGKDNWRLICREDHIEHALRHLIRYGTYGEGEDLVNAATRLLFALSTEEHGKYEKQASD